MTCLHTNQKFVSREIGWVCKACDAKIETKPKWTPEDGLPMVGVAHDVRNIAEENLESSAALAAKGITKGSDQEKVYADMVSHARSSYKKVDGVKAHYKIPPEVFFARRKEDPHYWDNPKNVERHSDMKIS